MLIIVAATFTAVALTSLLIAKGYKTDEAQLNEPRPSIPSMGVQIICGDCAGESLIPQKTYLDRHGVCEHCGGHSYILASALALYAMQARVARVAEYQSSLRGGRVLPFETPVRVSREKIA
jgi:hypothetical protein